MLLERHDELACAEDVIAAATAGTGSTLFFEGPPGIGKTTILTEVTRLADARGLAVLHCAGSELERELAFGLMRSAFVPSVLSRSELERDALFSGPAAIVRPLFGLGAGKDRQSHEAMDVMAASLHAGYWLTANLASERPLVISVDDMHWSDVPSLRFFAYLSRRIADLSVVLLLAARVEEPGAPMDLVREVASSASHVLRPRELSAEAVGLVVRRHLPGADDQFCDGCHRSTRGNPFFLRELLEELRTNDVSAERVLEMGPQTIARAVLRRIDRIGSEAPAVARALAVLGDGRELHQVAAVADLDVSVVGDVADSLAATGVLEHGRPLRFLHPIVRTAVHDSLSPALRARMHLAAARVRSAEGTPADQLAVHLLHTEPAADQWAVAVLRDAARAAIAHGAPATAVLLLRRALREPPDDRRELLLELGSAEIKMSDPLAAVHLRDCFELTADPLEKAKVARRYATALFIAGRSEEAHGLVDATIAELGPDARELVLQLEAALDVNALFYRSVARPDRLLRYGELEGKTHGERLILVALAHHNQMAGGPAERTIAWIERALRPGTLLEEEGVESLAYQRCISVLIHSERQDIVRPEIERALAYSRKHGSAAGFAFMSYYAASESFSRGALREVEAEARDAIDSETDQGLNVSQDSARALLIQALIERGAIAEAEAELAFYTLDTAVPETIFSDTQYFARGCVREAMDRHEEALADFLEFGRRHLARGIWIPNWPWRVRAASALAALGDQDGAKVLVDEELERARRFGTARPLAIALQALARLDVAAELQLLEEAARLLSSSPSRLEYARSLVGLGAALRRRNRRSEARGPLQLGIDIAASCNATVLVEQGQIELRATGARPRRVRSSGIDALTASELRVVKMAAEGMSNRQIAHSLFVSLKTVEKHLGNAYQKLGVSAREQLKTKLPTGA